LDSHAELVSASQNISMKITNAFIGVTNNLERRVQEHKNEKGSDFTSKYKLTFLVYYEVISDIKTAITREKQLKNWHRQWKINLIKEINPEMLDLATDWN
jgi:putative endonuclease